MNQQGETPGRRQLGGCWRKGMRQTAMGPHIPSPKSRWPLWRQSLRPTVIDLTCFMLSRDGISDWPVTPETVG